MEVSSQCNKTPSPAVDCQLSLGLMVTDLVVFTIISVPLTILYIPICAINALWLVVVSLYLPVAGHSHKIGPKWKRLWTDTSVWIFLPVNLWRLFLWGRKDVIRSANYVDLVDKDLSKSENIPDEFTAKRLAIIDAATEVRSVDTWPSTNDVSCFPMDQEFDKSEAEEMGIIDPHPNDDRKIIPLFLFYHGAGDFGGMVNAACASLDGLPSNFDRIAAYTDGVLKKMEEKNQISEKTRYVPVLVGHSMGGAFASIFACKYHTASLTFNTMGCGKALRECAGDEACTKANGEEAHFHLNLTFYKDWVSDPHGATFYREPLGKTVRLPLPNSGEGMDVGYIHNHFRANWAAFREKIIKK
jgi:hypothetical protein